MSYRQLIYCSRATREMTDQDLLDLLRESRDLNAQHGITGLLLYVEQQFMQCIEGAHDDIGQLVKNIQNDRRNDNFLLLMDRDREHRAFPQWTMGFRSMSLTGFCGEAGFRDIRSLNELQEIEHSSEAVFGVLANFYRLNAGKYF